MPDFLPRTLHDTATLNVGASHLILFRPGRPGPITILSVAARRPPPSDSPYLARLVLRQPGSGTPVMTSVAPADRTSVSLSYMATAEDLAVAGDWTCQLINGTDRRLTFDTDVTYVTDIPLLSASFDMELLSLLLSQTAAAAAVKVHLEGNGSGIPKSIVSWSDAFARLIGRPSFSVAIDDIDVSVGPLVPVPAPDAVPNPILIPGVTIPLHLHLRLRRLDSDPRGLMLSAGEEWGLPFIRAGMYFDTSGIELQGIGLITPDVDLLTFTLSAQLFLDGRLMVNCATRALARFNDIDVSDRVKHQTEGRVKAMLNEHGFTPPVLRQHIESFFRRLMRLGDDAQIYAYTASDGVLTVRFYRSSSPLARTPGRLALA